MSGKIYTDKKGTHIQVKHSMKINFH